jgi:ESS family glutamate:Na+ symporter
MPPLPVSAIWTLVMAVLAIHLGMVIHHFVPKLRDWNVPPAITGGLVFAAVLTIARAALGIEFAFADDVRQMLLLIFFAGVGLSAKFRALFKGGAGVAVICLAIVAVTVAQNLVGVAIARGFGLEPALGLFFGSIPFLGGHGTAGAWAVAPPAQGLGAALEIGMACATLGLIAGGLVAGPVASWLAGRATKAAPPEVAAAAVAEEVHAARLSVAELLNSDRWLVVLLVLGVCLGAGELLRRWAEGRGMVVPGFLAVMAVAILLTNAADLVRRPVDLIVTDLTGTVALRLFLAISMMGLKLWELAGFLLPLLVALVAQITAVTVVAVVLVYPLLDRGRQGAIGCGGFIGFALGAMPVGLGVMKRLTATFGEAPRAVLAVTLAGALFVDTANALLINLGFALLK